MEKIKVGVIGVGSMGQHHVRHFATFPDAELVAISDVDEDKRKFADKYNCKFYANYNDMLKNEELDCVSIAVPTMQHKQVIVDAIAKGVHIFIEKPITDDIADAEEIIKNVRAKNLKLMVGHIERFNPVIKHLKSMLENGEFGELISIETNRLSFYQPRIRDSGIIVDLAIHDIDLLNHLIGSKIDTMYAVATNKIVPRQELEDNATIVIKFKNGVIGKINVSWTSPIKIREMNIVGTKNVCKVDTISQKIEVIENFLDTRNMVWESFEEFLNKFEPKTRVVQEDIKLEPLGIELRAFLDAIKTNSEMPVTGEDGVSALRTALKAIESYKTGNVIRFN